MRELGLSLMFAFLTGCNPIADHLMLDAGAVDAGPSDAGSFDAGSDAGPEGPLVFEPGYPCAKDADCEGPQAICQTSIATPAFGGMGGMAGSMMITFPDGYCTADCSMQNQCAAGSECGVKKLIDTLEPFLMGMNIPAGALDQIPSQCLDLCAGTSQCRDGYVCQSLIEASGQAARLPMGAGFLFSKYCLPMVTPPALDAGVAP